MYMYCSLFCISSLKYKIFNNVIYFVLLTVYWGKHRPFSWKQLFKTVKRVLSSHIITACSFRASLPVLRIQTISVLVYNSWSPLSCFWLRSPPSLSCVPHGWWGFLENTSFVFNRAAMNLLIITLIILNQVSPWVSL